MKEEKGVLIMLMEMPEIKNALEEETRNRSVFFNHDTEKFEEKYPIFSFA